MMSICLLQLFALVAVGKLSPLTVKEIGLMLRSGYSLAAVANDLTTRHFLDTVDPAAEKTLGLSGATPEFVADLKSGRYAVPADEKLVAQQEMEAKARHRVAMDEESKRTNTLYQDQLARSRAETRARAPLSHALAAMVKGDLVVSENGSLNTFNDQPLEKKKLIGLYFSAHWCGPCRKFTPELVAYYNRVAAAHPEFEIIFVSKDRSAAAMEAYMRETQMPWPAVNFDRIPEKEALNRYAGSGIPCLVVVDGQGKVVSDSYAGTTYRGPEKVIEDLDKIFGNGGAAVAQGR